MSQPKLKYARLGIAALCLTWISITFCGLVSASDISTLPQQLANALFGGNVTLANVAVSVVATLTVVLLMSVMDVEFQIQLLVIVLVLALLTGLGWLDSGFFVFILIIVCLLFAVKAADTVFG